MVGDARDLRKQTEVGPPRWKQYVARHAGWNVAAIADHDHGEVPGEESLLRRLAKRSATKHGRQSLRPRVAVEHRLARIGGLQTDRARYKSTRKNTLDLRRHAAVANLIEIHAALEAAALDSVALAA